MSKGNQDPAVNAVGRMSFSDAAWAVGLTPEAFDHFVEQSGLKFETDRSGVKWVGGADLLKAGFALLAQKESQIAMLRMQLSSALDRERELSGAVRAGMEAVRTVVSASPVLSPQPTAPVRGKVKEVKEVKQVKERKKKK